MSRDGGKAVPDLSSAGVVRIGRGAFDDRSRRVRLADENLGAILLKTSFLG
jgi:hypothetical protein